MTMGTRRGRRISMDCGGRRIGVGRIGVGRIGVGRIGVGRIGVGHSGRMISADYGRLRSRRWKVVIE